MPLCRRRSRATLLASVAAAAATLSVTTEATNLMGLDLGQDFSEVTIIKDRAEEMALNVHSQRKTPSAINFASKVRTFGDEAVAGVTRQQKGAYFHFKELLGQHADSSKCSATDKADECKTEALHLRDVNHVVDYYDSLKLAKNETRGAWELVGDNGVTYAPELVMGNLIRYFKEVAEESNDLIPVTDAVLTVPSSWNQRQRQALVDAAKIAGLQGVGLIQETSAAALQLAMDWGKEKPEGFTETHLFYNLGARKCEVCIAEFMTRAAGMVAGRTSPSVVIKGCHVDTRLGGHFADLALADEMVRRFTTSKSFTAKKLEAAEFKKNKRALRKLLTQSKKTRHDLSASKEAFFSVEGLYEEIDFATKITRLEFEDLLEDDQTHIDAKLAYEAELKAQEEEEKADDATAALASEDDDKLTTKYRNPQGKFWSLVTYPIEQVLKKTNMTLADIDGMEVIGGAWRTPKVQWLLNQYLKKSQGSRGSKPALDLGQHLNGEESFVFGASLFAANASREIRPRKRVFFADTFSDFNYSMEILSLEKEKPLKNTTVIAAPGTKLGVKKKITLSDTTKDFKIQLFENGNLLTTWKVSGLEEAINDKYKHLVSQRLLRKVNGEETEEDKTLEAEEAAKAEADKKKAEETKEKGDEAVAVVEENKPKAIEDMTEDEKKADEEKAKAELEKKLESLKTLPKVGFTIGPDSSGILQLSKKVEALFVETFEEEVVDEQATYLRDSKIKADRAAKRRAAAKAGNATAENSTEEEPIKEVSEEKKEDSSTEEKLSDDKVEDSSKEKSSDDKDKAKDHGSKNSTTASNSTSNETKEENKTKEEDDAFKASDYIDTEPLPAPIMKKRLRRKNHIINLNLTREDEMPLPLSSEELSINQDLLFSMVRKDKEKIELEVLKNDLESMVYEVREKLEYNDAYKSSGTEEDKKSLIEMVDATEKWLEDDFTKDTELSEVKDKLAAIDKLFKPIKARAIEADSRADFIIIMDKEVKKMTDLKKQVQEMAWLKPEDVEKAIGKFDDFVSDWTTKKEEQEKKSGHEDPAFTKSSMEGYADRSFAELRRLSRTKKPKERKAPSSRNSSGASKKSVKQLQEELKIVENEISEIQAKKMSAIEEDDFDTAEILKKEEEKKKEIVRTVKRQLDLAKKNEKKGAKGKKAAKKAKESKLTEEKEKTTEDSSSEEKKAEESSEGSKTEEKSGEDKPASEESSETDPENKKEDL